MKRTKKKNGKALARRQIAARMTPDATPRPGLSIVIPYDKLPPKVAHLIQSAIALDDALSSQDNAPAVARIGQALADFAGAIQRAVRK